MGNSINHFLKKSMIFICIVCIGIFSFLAIYLSNQSEKTVGDLGNIYMANLNDRITKHFQTMTEHRLTQIESLTETTPDAYKGSKSELSNWLTYNFKARDFDSAAYYHSDGTMEMIYGDEVSVTNSKDLYTFMKKGENRLTMGTNKAGEQVVLVGVPASIDIPGMEDCIGLVGELPLSYISETLSLDEENSLVYSHVIRMDGSFVIKTSDAYRENYFERVRAVYDDAAGVTKEEYIKELSAAMKEDKDYAAIVKVDGERRHVYCSTLPNSEWYLVTLMPYGALNESVESMETRSLTAAIICCVLLILVLGAVFMRYSKLNQKQVKELAEAKQTAELASKSKSEFLSNMSHDIRTPMNAIVGMTAIATANVEDTQQVQNCLKKITLSSKHLLGLINDVLDMSKIESGKMTLNVESVSLREVMDSIVSIVQPQVKAKHQSFNVSIYNILSENVKCDSVRLNQIIINLLSNAIKFTPEGGTIDVTLHEEASPKEGDYVRIRIHVKDTGIGMSEEFQSELFEAFTREDNKRIHRTEGTGLGMAITKYIVDAMGGEIKVFSKQGEGTEFQVILDMERAEEWMEDMVLPDWNMLVVDDDRQLCESTVESLKSIGISAEWVLDGENAISAAMEHHRKHRDYQVILLDWKLPGIDGIDTARKLRRELGDDVPILLMSAYDWTEIEDEARAAGISGFLMKPLFRSTLYYGILPYTEGEAVQVKKEENKPKFSDKRILVAEDNELNWEIAYELLHDLGLELEWAENGQICLDMINKSEPGYYDAVLMDIRMPVMNGYEAADAIRAMESSYADIPIIAMTADAYSDDIKRCMEHGMNAHVAKPIDIKEIVRVLRRYIGM